MGLARCVFLGLEIPVAPLGARWGIHWAPIGSTLATRAANSVNPAPLCRFFDASKLSRLSFFRFFVDFDTLQTPEIIEKPWENLSFSMIFGFSVKSLPNQRNVAMGHAWTLEMEAPAA